MGIGRLKAVIEDVLSIIYPHVCEVCGVSLAKGEDTLCLHCLMQLPRTRLHTENFSVIHERLAGSTPINLTAGYFYYYKDSLYASLIHTAKYRNRPIVAEAIARKFAKELQKDGFFQDVDVIIPVPLHISKLIKRGYNQSEAVARGLSVETGIGVSANLVAKRGHSTQTRKGSFQRWLNIQDVYTVKQPELLDNKHVLIVDDVITTGATLLACCNELHRQVPTARISVLTLAVTHLH